MVDFGGILRALDDAGVRHILIGGAAATAHGAARLTQDIDVVYDRAVDNLERLVAALIPHDPYLRGAPLLTPLARFAFAGPSPVNLIDANVAAPARRTSGQ